MDKTVTPKSLFISMGLDMSWRLSLGVVVPIVAGTELDNALHTTPLFLLTGFALAIAGTVLIIRRTVRAANEHPVFNPSKKDGNDA